MSERFSGTARTGQTQIPTRVVRSWRNVTPTVVSDGVAQELTSHYTDV